MDGDKQGNVIQMDLENQTKTKAVTKKLWITGQVIVSALMGAAGWKNDAAKVLMERATMLAWMV